MGTMTKMAMPGSIGVPSRYCNQLAVKRAGAANQRVSALPSFVEFQKKLQLVHSKRNHFAGLTWSENIKKNHLIGCAMDASYGGSTNDPTAIFPRINIRDPYKRLGISKEASEDEIQAARNFLIKRYAAHRPSLDAIESAHDKIIMQKYYDRKKPKINIKKKVKEVGQSHVVQAVTSRFQTPPTKFIIKTSILFVALGVLTFCFPTEEGPTLQVAISLIATIYFIYDRLKSKSRAFLYGAGSFMFSWLLGTFLMVSVIPPILKGPRSLEVTTGLITYVLLWVSSTYLK